MPLSDEGRRIVDEARAAYGPSDEDRARVGASLSLRLTAAVGAASAATGASSAAATPAGLLAGKGAVLGLAALVVIGGASAGYWWSRSEARPRAPAAARAGSAPVAAPDQLGQPTAALPAAEPEAEPPRRASHSRPAARVPGAKAAPSEAGPDVAGEIALLGEAQRALASGQPEKALVLLDRHAREFPHGSLGQERAAARIIALCALGRVTTARAEAAAFLARSPGSPLAERVRAACGADIGAQR